MAAEKINVQVTVDANKQKVWEYYTLPEHIVNWNFASDDWQCPSATNDLKVGGKYKARMEAKDGSFGFDFEAIYTDIEAGQKISYSMGDSMTEGRKATVNFTEMGPKTEVHISFDAESENPIEMQRDGWQSILNNFKKYTEEN